MGSTALVAGTTFILVGLGLVFAAVLRSVGASWSVSQYEMWVLLVAGFALLLPGRGLLS